ncbi:glycosyltransferase [Neptuniibacter sp. PT8_73]|uniref:glycosyltransferase n=1 Tax=Neptuniibacter sp. PT8_73 TaxID=3398206 RepID=UPI0039F46C41
MANILVAWEFGGGLGHLTHLAPFITTLIERGHQVTLVTKGLGVLYRFEFPEELKVLPVPYALTSEDKPKATACIASILMQYGYSNRYALEQMVKSWRSIFDLVKPDLLICDYAPTALIAANKMDCKKVIIGSGFAELKPGLPCRILTPWVDGIESIAVRHEGKVVQTVNKILDPERKTIKYLGDLFSSNFLLMTTLPELDHYQRDRSTTYYIESVKNNLFTAKANWAENGKPKVFAYLKAHAKNTGIMIRVLAESGFDVICCCNGLAKLNIPSDIHSKIQLLDYPVDLSELLKTADIVVNHASKELVAESLSKGKPQLVLPAQLEQVENTRLIEKLNIGLNVPPQSSPQDILITLRRLLDEPKYRLAAEAIAERNATKATMHSYMDGVRAIENLLK